MKNVYDLDSEEKSIYVDLIVEAKDHLRHCQQLRTSYLHIYLLLYTAGTAAILGIISNVNTNELLIKLSSWIIGLLIWGIGLVTIARIELWSAHILHNLFIARRLEHILHVFMPILKNECNLKPKLQATNEFTKSPWSKGKSIDTLFIIISAGTGCIPFIIFPFYNQLIIGIFIAIAMIIFPFVFFHIQTRRLNKMHTNCCLQYSNEVLKEIEKSCK